MKKYIIIFSFLISVLGLAIRSIQSQDTAGTPITQEVVVTLLNALIKENATFSIRLAHPLLAGQVRIWQQKGLIHYPTPQTSWSTFKTNVHQLGAYLSSFLDKDPQTQAYYHLERLQQNQPLYVILKRFHEILSAFLAKAKQESLPKLSKELPSIINFYGTQFYQNMLLDKIKQFFEPFELEAKKIREQEEMAKKRAAGSESLSDLGYEWDLTDLETDVPYPDSEDEFDESFFEEDYVEPDTFDSEDFTTSFFES